MGSRALANLPPQPHGRVHFVGVGGSGLSALALFRVLDGGLTSGSDRSFDQGQGTGLRQALEQAGIQIFAQDGSGVRGASLVVHSTAVEAPIPDLARARQLGLPVWPRAKLLAHHLQESRGVAVAGTSGKSTVAAMLFTILRGAGRDPSLITGGALQELVARGLPGNAARGQGPLVVEADESDGSLQTYHPELSLVLNLHRDHQEPEQILKLFQKLQAHTRQPMLIGEDAELAPLRPGAVVHGFGPGAHFRGRELALQRDSSRFVVERVAFLVPLPGKHNAQNALAAVSAARMLGVALPEAARGLASFQGVVRRFEILGNAGGVEVVDDFAHNPRKIQAALRTAQARSSRVRALFQPHGFAPLFFFQEELVACLAATLRPEDRLDLTPVLYLGGTAQQLISSEDVASRLTARGRPARVMSKEAWAHEVTTSAARGDCILVMGARDPMLPKLSRLILARLKQRLANQLWRPGSSA